MQASISKYFELLEKWNERMNLVAAPLDERVFRTRHLRDAEELATLLANAGSSSLVDLGTGAGLPGILVKLIMPRLSVVLIDSTRKRVSFCGEAIRTLGLTDIRALCGRVEERPTQEQAGSFDAVVSRATWKIAEYLDISVGYMNESPGRRIFAMKSQNIDEELSSAQKTIEKQGLKLDQRHDYLLSDHTPRCILVFKPT